MSPLFVFVLAAVQLPAVDPAWAEKARAALPELTQRRVQLSSRLTEVCDDRMTARPGAKGAMTLKRLGVPVVNETTQLGGSLLVRSTTQPGGGAEEETLVVSRNEHYFFKLTKKGASGKFVLASYSTDLRKGGDFSRTAHTEIFTPMHSLLRALESKDGHQLRNLTWEAGRSLVVAEYQETSDDSKRSAEFRGLFDPSRGWAPVEYVTKTRTAVFETHFQYGFDFDGLTFPSVVESKATYHVTPAPPDYDRRAVIRSLKRTRATERDFRLSAFGLPEPQGAPPPRSGLPLYVYILGGAAACAVLGLSCRYLARRRK
jgi:hypothetical protein